MRVLVLVKEAGRTGKGSVEEEEEVHVRKK